MFYLLLALILITPLIIFGGLVFAFKKLQWRHFSVLIICLLGIPYLAYVVYERQWQLEAIPDALGVNSISYSKEETWGFGPGGNEAGIRAYPLPENVSASIKSLGVEYFKNMPPNNNQQRREWRGMYDDWEETPVKAGHRHWGETKVTGNLNIYDYICAYGFCIDIKPSFVKEANSIINSPGSFYAYGRIGMIVVSPQKNLVLYFYNG